VRKQQILIVTRELDPHADVMIMLLREMGHQPIRLHPADFPMHTQAHARYDGTEWHTDVTTRNRTFSLADVRSIWWRRPDPPTPDSTLTADEQKFASDEAEHALRGMWYGLEHECYWVSFPPAIRKASAKLGQMQQATRLGLQVPRTLITTDPDQVRQFYEDCDQAVIYKTLYNPQPLANVPKGIYTTPLEEEQLALLDTIRTAPGLFQEYIPKQVELRVTVIGDEVFSAELHSQVHERTRYDWRHYDVETPMQEHHLPDEVAEQCLALTRWYGLNFSTSDLILTPDGRYVFLEMNPNGQWFWVQDNVPSLKMKEAMAACLIRGANA